MTNTFLLKQAIEDSGIKNYIIAEKLGISRAALALKVSGENEFKASEVAQMTRILGLTNDERDKIFLNDGVI